MASSHGVRSRLVPRAGSSSSQALRSCPLCLSSIALLVRHELCTCARSTQIVATEKTHIANAAVPFMARACDVRPRSSRPSSTAQAIRVGGSESVFPVIAATANINSATPTTRVRGRHRRAKAVIANTLTPTVPGTPSSNARRNNSLWGASMRVVTDGDSKWASNPPNPQPITVNWRSVARQTSRRSPSSSVSRLENELEKGASPVQCQFGQGSVVIMMMATAAAMTIPQRLLRMARGRTPMSAAPQPALLLVATSSATSTRVTRFRHARRRTPTVSASAAQVKAAAVERLPSRPAGRVAAGKARSTQPSTNASSALTVATPMSS